MKTRIMTPRELEERYERHMRRVEAARVARNQKKLEAGRKKVAALPAEREMERYRRDLLRRVRKEVADIGYDGAVRLEIGGGAYTVTMDPVPGIRENRFTQNVKRNEDEDPYEKLQAKALAMADLSLIAQRRNAAIVKAGCRVDSPPAWAFVGHPVMRAVIHALKSDPSGFRPLDKESWQEGLRLCGTVHDLRIGYTGVKHVHNGTKIGIDAGNEMARIRIDGEWPETIVASVRGKPLCEVLGLPGLEPGTEFGDTPIRDSWQDDTSLGFTVKCRFIPLADAPVEVDTSWLDEWLERHVC